MRLLSRAAIGFAAIVLAAPTLHAQTSFSVAIGATAPMGDLADAVDLGYNATVGVGIKPPLAPLGLRFEGMFNSVEFKSPIDASLRIMAVTANGTYTLMPQLYAIGGVGMYNAKASTAGSSSDGIPGADARLQNGSLRLIAK